jgi:CspA family cold shock protein
LSGAKPTEIEQRVRCAGDNQSSTDLRNRSALANSVVGFAALNPPYPSTFSKQESAACKRGEMTMAQTGVVKWYNANKGYGFIRRDGEPDVFVHVTDLRAGDLDALAEGEHVTFDIIEGPRGAKATNVRIAESA